MGEGRAGKTSLANPLCARAFVQTDSTIGDVLEQMQVTQVALQVATAGRWTVLPQLDGHAGKFADDQLAWAIAQELEGRQGSSSGSIVDFLHVSQSHSSFDYADDLLVPSSRSGLEEPASGIPAPSSISSLASSSSSAAASSVQLDSTDAYNQAHLSGSDAFAQLSPSTPALSSTLRQFLAAGQRDLHVGQGRVHPAARSDAAHELAADGADGERGGLTVFERRNSFLR